MQAFSTGVPGDAVALHATTRRSVLQRVRHAHGAVVDGARRRHWAPVPWGAVEGLADRGARFVEG